MSSRRMGNYSMSKGSLHKSRTNKDHNPRRSPNCSAASMMLSNPVMETPSMSHFSLSSASSSRRSRQSDVASWVDTTAFSPDDDFLFLGQGGVLPEHDDALAYQTMMMESDFPGLDSYDTLALNTSSSRQSASDYSAYGPGSQLESDSLRTENLPANTMSMDFAQFTQDYQDADLSYCNPSTIQPDLWMSYGVLSPSLTTNNICDEAIPGLDYPMPDALTGMSAQPGRHAAPNQAISDMTVCEPMGPSALQQYSGPSRASAHPRPLRSASEKKDHQSSFLYHGLRNIPPAKSGIPNPRDDPRYEAKVGKDGYWRCPFANCLHKPTKQKCIYAKYLDSHLRPYRCKVKKAECQEKTFSSNACLFRHEREAHGWHGHGENPHLCMFAGCDRNKPGNGFPRKWNLGDHMKRVHNFDMTEDECSPESIDYYSPPEPPKKRKGSDGSTSIQMKRSSSSQAKAQAASGTYPRDVIKPVSIARHAPQVSYTNYNRMGSCNLQSSYAISMDNVQFSEFNTACATQTRHAPSYSAGIPYRVAEAY